MKILWMDIFGDSREYVNMIYDECADRDLSLAVINGNDLVASLTGVVYDFICDGVCKKCLYLCGLYTRKEYRKRGIMQSLINRIEIVALDRGIDCLFLIPADDDLRSYYARFGYQNMHSKLEIDLRYYINKFNKINEYKIVDNARENIRFCELDIDSKDNCRIYNIRIENTEMINSISRYLAVAESHFDGCHILHNAEDWQRIIRDCISSGGEVCEISVCDARCVLFLSSTDDGNNLQIVYDKNSDIAAVLISTAVRYVAANRNLKKENLKLTLTNAEDINKLLAGENSPYCDMICEDCENVKIIPYGMMKKLNNRECDKKAKNITKSPIAENRIFYNTPIMSQKNWKIESTSISFMLD